MGNQAGRGLKREVTVVYDQLLHFLIESRLAEKVKRRAGRLSYRNESSRPE